jgi:hypothetical protein
MKPKKRERGGKKAKLSAEARSDGREAFGLFAKDKLLDARQLRLVLQVARPEAGGTRNASASQAVDLRSTNSQKKRRSNKEEGNSKTLHMYMWLDWFVSTLCLSAVLPPPKALGIIVTDDASEGLLEQFDADQDGCLSGVARVAVV